MGFKGSVESFSLADVFQNLAMNQQTGTLHVFTGDGEEKFVYFQNGQVRYLSRGAKLPLLDPEVFYARGLVLRTQLDAGIARQAETKEPIGVSLIALNHITRAQLDQTAKHLMEEEIYDLFGWDKAQFEFNDGELAEGMFADQTADAASSAGGTLAISHLIMEAARRVDEWDRVRAQIPNFKEIYTLELAARKQIEKGEIETEAVEKRVAALIDSARDVDDIIADSFLFKFEVMTALSSFIHSQLIRPATLQELAFAEQECVRMQLPKRRIKVLERILAKGGENPRVRRELAELLAKEQQVEKACIHYGVLADVEVKAKREDAAIEIYKRILAISPTNVQAHEHLGAVHAKRGNKREAFVHFQEMFEILKDQNHLREARAAVSRALECDSTQTDLRNSLVELLLAENQKDAASEQLEILGDQAAKAGNVKLAVDSYRRSMQYRPANKQIKKKLADVMLTKEDRVARKRKNMVILVVILLAAAVAGALFYVEFQNNTAFKDAAHQARALCDKAEDEDKNEKFAEAEHDYQIAAALFLPIEKRFSPVLGVGESAKRKRVQLTDQAASMTGKASDSKERMERKSHSDLDAADSAKKIRHYDEAKESYTKVLKNPYSPPDVLKAAEQGNADVQKIIARFEDAMQKLQREKEQPNAGFESVEAESEFKLNLITDYNGFPRLNAGDIELPLFVKPNTSAVNVYIDGKLVGSVNENGSRAANTFRYPYGSHRFEFKKSGFKAAAVSTAELHSPVYDALLQREAAIEIDLRPFLGDANLAGDAVIQDDSIYTGTTDGALLQASISQKKVVRRFDLKSASPPISLEAYGPIYVRGSNDKPDLVVISTRDGEYFGLKADGESFAKVWEPGRIPDTGLSERPKPALLNISGKPALVLPLEKRLYVLDCETGLLVKDMPDFNARIKSSPAISDQNTIVAGAEDNVLYGLTNRRIVVRWTTSAGEATSLTGQPLFVDGHFIAGGNDGKLYWFDPATPGTKTAELLLASEILAQPVVIQKRLYVGTSGFDAVFSVDLSSHGIGWKQAVPGMGGISLPGAALGERVYFVTDKGRLYALDSEKGTIRWTYEIEGSKGFTTRPIVIGTRIWVVAKNGRILGFDEKSD